MLNSFLFNNQEEGILTKCCYNSIMRDAAASASALALGVRGDVACGVVWRAGWRGVGKRYYISDIFDIGYL
jgi:hypothetical protein